MMTTDLLIVGGSGFIGARAAQTARLRGANAACTYHTRPALPDIPAWQVDASDPAALRVCLEQSSPRAIVYCAVSLAPGTFDVGTQRHVSVDGLRVLINTLAQLTRAGMLPACRLVYVSTNAVFSGKHGPYQETDLPDPEVRTDVYQGYGLARREGEVLALGEWSDSIIARTANVDGLNAWGTRNLRLQRLVDVLRAGQALPRYVDRWISPTLVDSVAEALVEISSPAFSPPDERILHLAGSQSMTDFDYALHLARCLGVPETLVTPDHYLPPDSATRYNIALDVTRSQACLQTRLFDVDAMLDHIFP